MLKKLANKFCFEKNQQLITILYKRINIIENELKPLLSGYLGGNIELAEFKSKVDSINKRNELWGFKGIKGQMFFNMVYNVADDMEECDQELKSAISIPSNEPMASSRIKTFASYVKRLGEQWVEAGNTRHGAPKTNSIPFFLSYFWQIQDRDVWPVYYTNSVNTMQDINLWNPSGDLAQDYIKFKQIHEELAEAFTENSEDTFNLYKVEHAFWHKGTNLGLKTTDETKKEVRKIGEMALTTKKDEDQTIRLPESYVPPIIAVLPKMALNEETLKKAATNSGISLERAFEKNIDIAFRILGFDTKLMGQGGGRVPDGFAGSYDDGYAIIWDAKIRADGYSMGTDDRTIREYVTTQSRELKKKRSLKNIYYIIISSHFANDFDENIRSIKMETDVNEVILMEAEALVTIVDAKLREPQQVTLGPDGIQRMFSISGLVTSQTVKEQLIQ